HGWVADQLQRLRGSLKDCQILELYAGAAAMGLALAARGARVTAVDQYAPSLAQAKRAASAQGLSLDTRAEPAEQALSLVQTQNYEAVIVDPPRRGLSPAVREAMGGAAARWFVYVSCEPTTLARDLAHLARLGLRVEQLAPLDMIPHSESVETAVLLVRGAPVPPEVLYRDGCLLAIDKPAFLSLHHRQGGQPSLLDRVRSLDGFETAVPLDSEPLDTAASGVCWFLARPELLTQFSHAWQARDEHWSVLAQGVLRGKGRLGPFTYRRERVVGTHSLLSVSCLHEAADARSASGQAPRARRERTRPIGSYLKPIRHPLLGDERFGNPAANRYFIERHGLDRPFLHRRLVSWRPYGEAALEVSCEIPAELRQVLESLSAETGAAPGD
ncbi:MAG TPA: RsmD family RNA methyltransferase, partial [Polyangiaceae bacterium]|nr:RsmD family RNA methyltransferase [Polyangiaceae bacterium]